MDETFPQDQQPTPVPGNPPSLSQIEKLTNQIEAELIDGLDEELEYDLEDLFEEAFSLATGREIPNAEDRRKFRLFYFKELRRLQVELVRL